MKNLLILATMLSPSLGFALDINQTTCALNDQSVTFDWSPPPVSDRPGEFGSRNAIKVKIGGETYSGSIEEIQASSFPPISEYDITLASNPAGFTIISIGQAGSSEIVSNMAFANGAKENMICHQN